MRFFFLVLMLAGNIASSWVSCCCSFNLSTSYDDTNKLSKQRGVCELGLCYCCIQIFSSLSCLPLVFIKGSIFLPGVIFHFPTDTQNVQPEESSLTLFGVQISNRAWAYFSLIFFPIHSRVHSRVFSKNLFK